MFLGSEKSYFDTAGIYIYRQEHAPSNVWIPASAGMMGIICFIVIPAWAEIQKNWKIGRIVKPSSFTYYYLGINSREHIIKYV